MSMQSLSNYTSSAYRDISWKSIFCEAGMAVSENKNPMGLVNRQNMIMVPNNFTDYDHFQICFPFDDTECISNDILYRPIEKNLFSELVFLEINGEYSNKINENKNEAYLQFLREIVFRINSTCQSIFKYTYEHLSHRYYDDCVISKIPIIQSDFSDLHLKIEKLTASMKNIFCILDAVYSTSIAIEILSILSKLSGARSILRNRSIELMYHLKLFKKFIGDSNNDVTGASHV